MAEVRFQIPDDVINGLRAKIGVASNTDVAREALTLLNWAADERRKGRVILSADPEMKTQLVRLALPTLERITPEKEPTA
jgi:hypothetical protein